MEKCGCIPWDYPQFLDDITTICDGPQSACFLTAMENGYPVRDCGCEKDCEEIYFEVSDISKEQVDGTSECMRRVPEGFQTKAYFNHQNTLNAEERFKLYEKNDVALLLSEKIRLYS